MNMQPLLLSTAFDLSSAKINEYLTYIQEHQLKSLDNISSLHFVSHHIIPRSWYKQNNLQIDESKSNKIFLLHKDHCIAHILLAQYYIERNDKLEISMLLGMCNAVNRMLKKNSSTYPFINNLSKDEIDFLANNYQKIMVIYRKKWNNLIRITNGNEDKLIDKNDPIPNGWYRGRSIAGKRITITDGIKIKRINKNSPIPDGWKVGTCINACKDTIWINDGKHNKRILKTANIPEGYVKGQIANRVASDNFKFRTKNKRVISNGKESKFIAKDDPLPDGWHYGKKDADKGKKPYNFNSIWITNGIQNKYVNNKSIIPDGWRLGLTQKTNKQRPRKKWITNGNVTLQVDYDSNLPEGFYNGRSDIKRKI